MGGGGSKKKVAQAKTNQQAARAFSKGKSAMSRLGNSNYLPAPRFSDDPDALKEDTAELHVVMYVQPGSNDLSCFWLSVDSASGLTTACAPPGGRGVGARTSTIPVMKRVANGGGTVEDIVFLDSAAAAVADHVRGSHGLVLVVDVLSVEGQALLRHLWARNDWMRTSQTLVVLIAPTLGRDGESDNATTTHPALYGPAYSALNALICLGLDFGGAFLRTRKRRVPANGGERKLVSDNLLPLSTLPPAPSDPFDPIPF